MEVVGVHHRLFVQQSGFWKQHVFGCRQGEKLPFYHLTAHHDELLTHQYYISPLLQPIMPGPRIVPSCHSGWGAVSDLGGSYAERGFKMGHRHSGTTTRAKTAPFQLSFHTLIFRCFVLIPSLCLLSASFFPLC